MAGKGDFGRVNDELRETDEELGRFGRVRPDHPDKPYPMVHKVEEKILDQHPEGSDRDLWKGVFFDEAWTKELIKKKHAENKKFMTYAWDASVLYESE